MDASFESPLEQVRQLLGTMHGMVRELAPNEVRAMDLVNLDETESWRPRETGIFALEFENGRGLQFLVGKQNETGRAIVHIIQGEGFHLRVFDAAKGHYEYSSAILTLEDFHRHEARFRALTEQMAALPTFRPLVHQMLTDADMAPGEKYEPGVHGWGTAYILPQVGRSVCIDISQMVLDLDDDGNFLGTLPAAKE